MNQEKTGQDKREFPRITKNVTLTVKRLQYPLSNVKADSATMKNMANRGICFATSESYDSGTLLNLEINLHGWQHYLQNVSSIIDTATIIKPLTAIAEVAWSKKLPNDQRCEVGVRFKNIYEDDFQAFQKYLEKITDKLMSA